MLIFLIQEERGEKNRGSGDLKPSISEREAEARQPPGPPHSSEGPRSAPQPPPGASAAVIYHFSPQPIRLLAAEGRCVREGFPRARSVTPPQRQRRCAPHGGRRPPRAEPLRGEGGGSRTPPPPSCLPSPGSEDSASYRQVLAATKQTAARRLGDFYRSRELAPSSQRAAVVVLLWSRRLARKRGRAPA